jgi:hypothetical protein
VKNILLVVISACLLICSLLSFAQQPAAVPATNAVVPPLVKFSGVLSDLNGKPLSGTVGVTFALYKDQQGGAPLWLETQNVQVDRSGHYSVMLGSTSSAGLPAEIFAGGEARWLGFQPQGQAEQPRVLLLSVPYALKAGDAQTLGGLPSSAFVLAAPPVIGASGSGSATASGATGASGATPPASVDVTTTGGTVNTLPLFSTSTNIQNSILTQTGTSAINLAGKLIFPSNGTATASKGADSQPEVFIGSAFNSTSSVAANQKFQWQVEPANNDTASPSGTLNLLYASGTAAPAETGLHIASGGQITFATGQTFPGTGTGDGTVTSVGSGAGLAGGPISTSGTLSIATGGVSNAMLANPSLTVAAGADLTGGGSVALGGSVTLNLDTTRVPQLGALNTFATTQTISNGNLNLPATTSQSAGVINLGGSAFLHECCFVSVFGYTNTFVGQYAGNFTSTGTENTGTGWATLANNTTGYFNTASGYQALAANTTGNENTAFGGDALTYTTTGVENTAVGTLALYLNTTGGGNTAVGFQTLTNNTTANSDTAFGVSALNQNTTGSNDTAVGLNALVSNTGGNNNTATGLSALAYTTTGSHNVANGYEALYNNTTGGYNVAMGEDALHDETTAIANTGIGNQAGRTADGSNLTGSNNTALGTGTKFATGTLANASAIGANAEATESNTMVLGGIDGVNGQTVTVKVGIGTTTPDVLLSVNGNADKPGGGSWGTYSDGRLKTVHGSFNAGLSQILKIQPVRYRYKADNAMGIRDSDEHVGVVAQEVQRIIPEAVTENSKGYLLVNNDPILWSMLNAIKEQQGEFQREQAQLATALRQIKQQQSLLRAQNTEMRKLEGQVVAARESLRKVKAQLAAAQPTVMAAK